MSDFKRTCPPQLVVDHRNARLCSSFYSRATASEGGEWGINFIDPNCVGPAIKNQPAPSEYVLSSSLTYELARRDQKRKATPLRGAGFINCGEWGIRTPDTLLEYTRFPSVRLKPLGQLSLTILLNSLIQ